MRKDDYIAAYDLLLFAVVASIGIGVTIYYIAPLLRAVLFGD